MNDAYLREKLAVKHPWINPVYEQTSDFVHLSGRHFFNTFLSADKATGLVLLFIGGTDPPHPDSVYFEIVDTFLEVSKVVAVMLLGYFGARASIFEQ